MSSDDTAPTELPMILFDFSIWDIKDLEMLLDLKQDNFFRYRKPRRFSIHNESYKFKWNHKLFGALTEVFFHFHEKGLLELNKLPLDFVNF